MWLTVLCCRCVIQATCPSFACHGAPGKLLFTHVRAPPVMSRAVAGAATCGLPKLTIDRTALQVDTKHSAPETRLFGGLC